eukprot:Gb_17694 [translate_table: standard]
MMNATNYLHFRLKFTLSLTATNFQLLHCYYLAIRKNAFVYITKTPLS